MTDAAGAAIASFGRAMGRAPTKRWLVENCPRLEARQRGAALVSAAKTLLGQARAAGQATADGRALLAVMSDLIWLAVAWDNLGDDERPVAPHRADARA
jgi:hypothetical protein